jgi:hypothetical protein
MFTPQDTLKINPPQPELHTIQLSIPVSRPRIDRAQEIIEQVAEREQKTVQQILFVPRIRKPRQPSIEGEPLMDKYQDIGCKQPVDFPDTMTLTILERHHFLPIRTLSKELAAGNPPDTSLLATSVTNLSDSVSVSVSVSAVALPVQARDDNYPSVSIMLFLLGLLAFFTWIKYHFGRSLASSVRSFINYRQSCRMQEERKEFDRQAALYVNVFCCLVLGIFVSLSLPALEIEPLSGSYSLSILFFSSSAAILFSLNVIVWKIFGDIFLIQPVTQEYVHNLFLYNRNTGIIIFPLVLAIPFVANGLLIPLIYTIITVIAGVYLLRVFRFFQIIHAKKVSAFYFLLYLCTLEILPFFMLMKACKSLIDCIAA